jgi:hypothetical protein
MAAKAACLAPVTPPPGGLGTFGPRPPGPPIYNLKIRWIATYREIKEEITTKSKKEEGLKYFIFYTFSTSSTLR